MALTIGDVGVFLFDPLQPLTLWEFVQVTSDGVYIFKCSTPILYRHIDPDVAQQDFWVILPASE
jgi:hypothetical protein